MARAKAAGGRHAAARGDSTCSRCGLGPLQGLQTITRIIIQHLPHTSGCRVARCDSLTPKRCLRPPKPCHQHRSSTSKAIRCRAACRESGWLRCRAAAAAAAAGAPCSHTSVSFPCRPFTPDPDGRLHLDVQQSAGHPHGGRPAAASSGAVAAPRHGAPPARRVRFHWSAAACAWLDAHTACSFGSFGYKCSSLVFFALRPAVAGCVAVQFKPVCEQFASNLHPPAGTATRCCTWRRSTATPHPSACCSR